MDDFWFEVAVVSAIYAIGNMLFGHFEEHTPKLRRVFKYFLTIAIVIALSYYFGRTIAMIVLGLMFIPPIYIHTIILPKKGINGWTAEPKERYYELRGWDKNKLYRNERQID